MKGGNGSKDIGAVAVYATKDINSQQVIEASQASHLADRIQDRSEAVVHHVPRRSSRMEIIANETNPVDEQEYNGVLQAEFTLPCKEKADAEAHWSRNPAKVEKAAHEIQEGTMMLDEVFVCGKDARSGWDAEDGFLRLVEMLNVDGIDHIVGINPHPIV